MAWKCLNPQCRKKIDDITAIKCPYCGYRIFQKERPPIVKKAKAI
jgi:DNA-directed RNA polymerase subunit RPC12/RpoP